MLDAPVRTYPRSCCFNGGEPREFPMVFEMPGGKVWWRCPGLNGGTARLADELVGTGPVCRGARINIDDIGRRDREKAKRGHLSRHPPHPRRTLIFLRELPPLRSSPGKGSRGAWG